MALVRYLFVTILSVLSLSAIQHKVLFLSSYHASFPTLPKQLAGIKSVLHEDEISLDVEYMDTKRFHPADLEMPFVEYLQKKQSTLWMYDVILTGDDNALRFAIKYHDTLFKAKPIVFFAINDEEYAKEAAALEYVTGVIEKASMQETLDVMWQLHPEAEKIVAISDATTTGQGIAKVFQAHTDEKVSLFSLKHSSYDQMRLFLEQSDSRTLFLFLSAFADKSGKRMAFYSAIDFIKTYTNQPIYHLYEHGVGEGLVGGKVVMFSEQGRIAATMVRRLLEGVPIGEIAYIDESPNRYMFDYLELKKHDADMQAIPFDSILMNEPRSVWEKYWVEFLSASVILIFLFSVVLVFMYLRLRGVTEKLKEHEHELMQHNNALADQVEHEVAIRLAAERDKHEKESLLVQQSKMAAMGEMIGAIAHQWKQPINSIALIAQTIDDLYEHDELSEEEMQKEIGSILEQVDFMDQTINDFSNFFKPSKTKRVFKPCEAIAELERMFGKQYKNKGIEIVISPHEHFETYSFPNEFKQVALNILNNAKDVLIEREIENARIICDFESDGKSGICRIRDNGGGIPQELLPDKLFDSYVSTKGDQGTGIGLKLAKEIIEINMDGKLWAHNVNNGAEFVIELPLVEEETES